MIRDATGGDTSPPVFKMTRKRRNAPKSNALAYDGNLFIAVNPSTDECMVCTCAQWGVGVVIVIYFIEGVKRLLRPANFFPARGRRSRVGKKFKGRKCRYARVKYKTLPADVQKRDFGCCSQFWGGESFKMRYVFNIFIVLVISSSCWRFCGFCWYRRSYPLRKNSFLRVRIISFRASFRFLVIDDVVLVFLAVIAVVVVIFVKGYSLLR